MSTIYVPLSEEPNISTSSETFKERNWSFICYPSLESCCLAHIYPCHIIGSVGKSIYQNYNSGFVFYIFFYGCLFYSLYIYNFLINKACPSIKTDMCLFINNSCSNEYTYINGNYYPCVYNSEYNLCYPGQSSCIEIKNYNKVWDFFYILHVLSLTGIFFMHLYLRLQLRKKHKIKNTLCKDTVAVICLPTCSLSQMYRETLIDNDIEISINV